MAKPRKHTLTLDGGIDDVEFVIPRSCMASFAEVYAGEYRLPIRTRGRPVVLDIGANVGAFAVWASIFLNAKSIECYEPNRSLLPYLRHNTSRAPCPVAVHGVGVGDPERAKLYEFGNSPPLYSQYELRETQGCKTMDIDVIHPSHLKPADIVKIDAEGAEGYICEHLLFVPMVLIVETHSDALRLAVERAVAGRMTLVESRVCGEKRSLLKFVIDPTAKAGAF